MIEDKQINEQLAKSNCYKCGESLNGAKMTTIGKLPAAVIAHTVCPNCQAESIITLTLAGSGIMPLISDLGPSEMQKFATNKPTSYDDLFKLHDIVKKGKLWKLLQRSAPLSENKIRN
ncbi:hypothetical protein HYV31_02720 [candidate division WWE3 bacterium]|nr:hypothetical protein [candidate division WWE3 bacterium]